MDFVYFFYMDNGSVVTGLRDSKRNYGEHSVQVCMPAMIERTTEGYFVQPLVGTDIVDMNLDKVSMVGKATHGKELYTYVAYLSQVFLDCPELKEEFSKMTNIDFDKLDEQITEYLEGNVPPVEIIEEDMVDAEENPISKQSSTDVQVKDAAVEKALAEFFDGKEIETAVNRVLISRKYH